MNKEKRPRGNPNWKRGGESPNPSGVADPLAKFRKVHNDGFANVMTGIGTVGRDKRMGAIFKGAYLTYQQALDLWTKHDIGKRVVEFPANEAFREGYEISIADEGSYDDLKDKLEQKLSDLEVDNILCRALCMERALGGCAILVGYKDGKSLDQPVDLKKAYDIEWLSLLEPNELYPIEFYTSVKSSKYNEPKLYAITGSSASMYMEGHQPPPSGTIHESRLIIFTGHRVSRYQIPSSTTGMRWGESVLVTLLEALRDFDVAWQSAGLLATDFAAPTLQIPNLMNLIIKHPQVVAERLAAIQMSLSNARVIALDSAEKYERKTTNLAGFAELLTQISLRLAAGTGIPLRLLMGQIPTTIGESDTDIRVFYDFVRGLQKNRLTPILKKLIGVLMRSLSVRPQKNRKVPSRWGIKWHPLWVLTDQEKAEARLAQARVDSMYLKSGVVTPNEIRRSRFVGEYSFETQVEESGDAPGPVPPGMMQSPDGKPVHPPPPPMVPTPPGGPTAGKPAAGTSGHVVRPYARKNPTAKSATTAAKQGGDVTTGGSKEKRDHMDSDEPLYFVNFAGFRIGIESPVGSIRKWVDQNGVEGETKMIADYGYIAGVAGIDGDCLDCYLGPDPGSTWVTVVRTMSPRSGFQTPDEDKVFLGYSSVGAALNAFSSQYSDPRFLGAVSAMSLSDFHMQLIQGATASGIQVTEPHTSPLEDIAPVCTSCGDLVEEPKQK